MSEAETMWFILGWAATSGFILIGMTWFTLRPYRDDPGGREQGNEVVPFGWS